MMFPNVVLDGVGKTCSDISIEVAQSQPLGSAGCTTEQSNWFGRCCTGSRPSGADLAMGALKPQEIPPTPAYTGPYPPCELCITGDYPYATSMVVNFLYIGVGTCPQYWAMGKQGLIMTHMCTAVQFFAQEPCGCGEYNPYFNPNHPLAQQAQQAPVMDTSVPVVETSAPVDNGGRTDTDTSGIPTQREPSTTEDKTGMSIGGSSGRGGSGGNGVRRGLKGSSV